MRVVGCAEGCRRRLVGWTLTLAVGLTVLAVAPVGAQQEGSPEELRRVADDVMARAEFQRPGPTVIERVRDWVGERLSGLLEGLTGGGAGTVIGWVILVAAVGALVWSLSRLGRSVRADPAMSARVRIDEGRSPDEWREEAERLEVDGEWKLALRCRYRALLGDLVRSAIIDDVPGRTSGEYRREVEAVVPDATGPMVEATELFEWAWYADLPTGSDESGRFRRAAEAVTAAADGVAGRTHDVVGVG